MTSLWNRLHYERVIIPYSSASLPSSLPLTSPPPSPHPPTALLSSSPKSTMDHLRHDWTTLPTLIIDPSGCEDADDAFSIWKDHEGTHLMVHIADPTALFDPDDHLFQTVIQRGTTFYPSGTRPIHLFPESILDASKLNADGPRRVISVHSIFKGRGLSRVKSTVEIGWIQTTLEQRITYTQAGERLLTDTLIHSGVSIAKLLYTRRTADSKESMALAELNQAYPLVAPDGTVELQLDTPQVREAKRMIAEFAIHANQVFASTITQKTNLHFRRAVVSPMTSASPTPLPDDVITGLIRSGKTAIYTEQNIAHDLLNVAEYTHATSPLRRAADCIAHFLIKSQLQDTPIALFSNEQLAEWSVYLTKRARLSKSLGFLDTKIRLLQYISQNLPIKLEWSVISYVNGFLNIRISRIREFPVHLTYTLRRNIGVPVCVDIPFETEITLVNLPGKFDEGTLPELDTQVMMAFQ